jgi:hypothetical protein
MGAMPVIAAEFTVYQSKSTGGQLQAKHIPKALLFLAGNIIGEHFIVD